MTASKDYKVGYGRPPEHSRFKRGQSGNPRGRPRKHRNFRTVLRRARLSGSSSLWSPASNELLRGTSRVYRTKESCRRNTKPGWS
jgi:Family of unknown function (DUF5681)